MQQLLQAVWGGLLFGSVYGLMAIGLTLIWGSLNLLNLAHGALYVAGGYAAWTLMTGLGVPILLSFLGGLVGAALIGGVLYSIVVKPMLGRPGWDNASWIATVGFSIVIENGLRLIYGPRIQEVPLLLNGSFTVNGVLITHQGLAVAFIAVAFLFLLQGFLRTSRHGLAIRAVSQNSDAAQLMGIPVQRVFLIVMVVSAALAGLAGVLLTSVLVLNPFAGFLPLLKALIVTIFGGLGSVKGTIVGAYVIGLLEALTQVYLGVGWSLPVLFLFIIVVLIIRPNGLYGVGEVQRL